MQLLITRPEITLLFIYAQIRAIYILIPLYKKKLTSGGASITSKIWKISNTCI